MRYKILTFIFSLVFCLASSTAFAQTRTYIAHGTWNGYGTPNPINSGTIGSGAYFLYPYIINAPNCFAINSTTAAPWDPNSVATDYYVTATNAAVCAGGGAPNPAQGIYYKLSAPHRAIGIIEWIRLNGNITSAVFINRLNDCTHPLTTGVFEGCIDYAALQADTSNRVFSDITGSGTTSAALTLGTWYQLEWCFIAGTNGSATIPSKESAWLNGTQFINNATPPTTTGALGGGNGITIDYEFGAGGTMDFGPWLAYDSGSACPASALATFYEVSYQPTSNGTVQFTPAANTNWQNAAAATPGALSYNADATVAAFDIYNMTLGTHSNILAIGQRASVEKTASGTRVAQLGWNISGTTYECAYDNGLSLGGDSLPLYAADALQIGTYQQIGCIAVKDPSTGSAWSGAGNASKVTITVDR